MEQHLLEKEKPFLHPQLWFDAVWKRHNNI